MLLYYLRAIYRPGAYIKLEPSPRSKTKKKRVFTVAGRLGSQKATEVSFKEVARKVFQDAQAREARLREDEETLLLQMLLEDL